METNEGIQTAWDFVEHTGKSIFLTGKAGTGKTTFLKSVVRNSTKRMVVVAPTGVAAINAGGVTIHSFFQLPLSPFVPTAKIKNRYDFSKEKRKIISTIDILVIDEISMVRSDLLDAVDNVLRRYRDHDKPFGGVQLLMIGDLGQLIPVVTQEDETMLKPYYDTPYFFGSHALALVDYVTIQLDHVYRQQDIRFLNILNHIRDGKPTTEDLTLLNQRVMDKNMPVGNTPIRLTTHNMTADRHNETEMQKLTSQPFDYNAEIDGVFPEYLYPTAEQLTLKVGAQVMFIKNDPTTAHRYYNGRIGKVVETTSTSVKVLCPDDDKAIEVEPQDWENAKYTLNEKTKEIETEIQGVFRQLPLRLAWAITIHKSQGLTFDNAVIDANFSFSPGQVYVALSRCRTLEGMWLAAPLSPSAIISDQRVETYLAGQQQAAIDSTRRLPEFKEEYYRHLLLELFDFHRIAQHEEALCRVFIEFLSRSNPQLTSLHKQTLVDMNTKVTTIAAKWAAYILSLTISSLHEADFVERVKRSAEYFYKTLTEIFQDLLRISSNVQTSNKAAQKRIDSSLADLSLAYRAHIGLLEAMTHTTFSVASYLKAKQETLLDAMEERKIRKRKRQSK